MWIECNYVNRYNNIVKSLEHTNKKLVSVLPEICILHFASCILQILHFQIFMQIDNY